MSDEVLTIKEVAAPLKLGFLPPDSGRATLGASGTVTPSDRSSGGYLSLSFGAYASA